MFGLWIQQAQGWGSSQPVPGPFSGHLDWLWNMLHGLGVL